jgi:ribokinase
LNHIILNVCLAEFEQGIPVEGNHVIMNNKHAPRIVIVGSLNMDVVIEVERPPIMGETILGQQVHYLPGGKGANQAVAAARLEAVTTMIGSIGNDAFGNQIQQAMLQCGIVTDTIHAVEEENTGIASIILAGGNNSIIVVPGANTKCNPADIDRHKQKIADADVVLMQLEIPVQTVVYTAALAKRYGKLVIVNPAPAQPLPSELMSHIDFLTPNRSELAILAQMPEVISEDASDEVLASAIQKLQAQGVGQVIVTLGEEGAAIVRMDGSLLRVFGHKMEVIDTTGAGDCFNAALACGIARGQQLLPALEFAVAASALSVTKLGAQGGMPALVDVQKLMAQLL